MRVESSTNCFLISLLRAFSTLNITGTNSFDTSARVRSASICWCIHRLARFIVTANYYLFTAQRQTNSLLHKYFVGLNNGIKFCCVDRGVIFSIELCA